MNLATVGVFSWAWLEPSPGEFDFSWLREVLDLLDAASIAVALATPTAAPPPWLSASDPEVLPVTADGVRYSHGSRQHFCVHSPVTAMPPTRSPAGWPANSAITRRSGCGTCTTSTPATSRSATAMPLPWRSGTGCAVATGPARR